MKWKIQQYFTQNNMDGYTDGQLAELNDELNSEIQNAIDDGNILDDEGRVDYDALYDLQKRFADKIAQR